MQFRTPTLLAPAFLLGLMSLSASGQGGEPLEVRAQVAPGVRYMGQTIMVQVGVVAEGERPEVAPPKIAGADLTLAGTSFRPISASGIGDFVRERNQFLSRFRLVPHRAGTLEIPPFRARLGERIGASRSLRLSIEAPPLVGRPAEFLGGVGPFEVAAKASPTTLRAGQEFEFRIRLTGPGALGATRGPSLARFDRVPLGLRVEPLLTEAVAEPPSRVFHYRLRPTRAGEAVLPPVAIAAFDPKSNQYVTKVTAGVSIRVVTVPRFDPTSLDYSPKPNAASTRSVGRGTLLIMTGAGLLLTIRVLAWAWRRTDRRSDLGRLARRLACSFDAGRGPEEAAQAITDGFIEYLALTTARPRGALTPDEARRGILQAAGSTDLAARAEGLVARCDRVRFARADADTEELVGAARLFFNDLGRVTVRKWGGSEEGEQPREAVETATCWEWETRPKLPL
jgi:hypothetical protein